MVNALASGALSGSPALAARLVTAESELSKLKEPAQDRTPIERLIPRIGERYLAMVKELNKTAERDPQRARMALVEALVERITLHPENGVLVADQLQTTAATCGQRVGKYGSGGRDLAFSAAGSGWPRHYRLEVPGPLQRTGTDTVKSS